MQFWDKLCKWIGVKSAEEANTQEIKSDASGTQAAGRIVGTKGGRNPKSEHLNAHLFFSGWGYDDREDLNTYREEGKNVTVVHAAGRVWALRKMNKYVVFRRVDSVDEREALFLTHQELAYNAKITPVTAEGYMQEYQVGAYGRCLLFVGSFMSKYQCAYLFFHPDGTGFALGEYEEYLAEFRWNDTLPLDWPVLLAANPETLRPLCRTLFSERINPRLSNPYINVADLQNVPHTFECGSEEELKRITVAIVQSDAQLFTDNPGPIKVTYRAKTPTKRAYMMKTTRKQDTTYGYVHWTPFVSGRLQSLCDLALRLNTFTGVAYETRHTNNNVHNRLGHFARRVHNIEVIVSPPSRHEQAELLLMLNDWLEGKVRPAKQRRLLGLDDENGN